MGGKERMRDFTEIWQLQDTIITAVNACGYGVWDLHATSWGFHLELTEHLDDAKSAISAVNFRFLEIMKEKA